jgi:hypothetical protein
MLQTTNQYYVSYCMSDSTKSDALPCYHQGQRDTLTQNNDRPSMLFPEIEHCQQAACTTAPQQTLK